MHCCISCIIARRIYGGDTVDIFEEIKNDVRSILLSMFGQEIPLAVSETIEALWEEKRRPQVHAKKRSANGYTFTIALPAGVSYRDFASKADYFRDSAGGNKINVSISQSGKMAILQISTNMLGDYFAYDCNYPKEGILPIPIGHSKDGIVVVDLISLPHLLIGGTTGGGKSNAIHCIANSLLSLSEPPMMILIDLKVAEYTYLGSKVMLVTELDIACQALRRLVSEMRQRQQLLKESKFVNIVKYNARCTETIPYIVLIIDELAELKDKEAQEDLETLLRLCRASGICIIGATQRPSAKIFSSKSFGDAKANFVGRLCYQTISGIDSRIILDSSEGADLPAIPGRAYWRHGRQLTEVQTPYFDIEGVQDIDQLPPTMLPERLKTR